MAYLFQIISNYCFIQCAILLFIAPFYGWYLRKRHLSLPKVLFANEHIAAFFTSPEGNIMIFCWAALEALNWFVIPEFLLLLIVFMRIQKKVSLLLSDIGGTTVGTLVAILFAKNLPVHLETVAYIHPSMIQQVALWYKYLGVWGLLFQPFSGIPYKVFTLMAYQFHFPFLFFLIIALLVRLSRYYFFYYLFNLLYPLLHHVVYKNYLKLFFIACFLFTIALLRVSNYYGDNYHIDYLSLQRVSHWLVVFHLH